MFAAPCTCDAQCQPGKRVAKARAGRAKMCRSQWSRWAAAIWMKKEHVTTPRRRRNNREDCIGFIVNSLRQCVSRIRGCALENLLPIPGVSPPFRQPSGLSALLLTPVASAFTVGVCRRRVKSRATDITEISPLPPPRTLARQSGTDRRARRRSDGDTRDMAHCRGTQKRKPRGGMSPQGFLGLPGENRAVMGVGKLYPTSPRCSSPSPAKLGTVRI